MGKLACSMIGIVGICIPAIVTFDGQGASRGNSSVFFLVVQEPVQLELGLIVNGRRKNEWYSVRGLAREQNKAVADYTKDVLRMPLGRPTWDYNKTERENWMEKRNKIADDYIVKLKQIISQEQWNRLKQINWQYMGVLALLDAELVNEMQITDEQKAKIKDLNNKFDHKQLDAFAKTKDRSESFYKSLDSMAEERERTIMDVLTESQRTKFSELKGKPFDLSQMPRN